MDEVPKALIDGYHYMNYKTTPYINSPIMACTLPHYKYILYPKKCVK